MKRTLFAITALAFLAACGGSDLQRVPQLDEARAKVEALSDEGMVQEVAGRELQSAFNSLKEAEAAYLREEPLERVIHLSYVAGRTADIGQAMVDEAEFKDQLAKLEFERDRAGLRASGDEQVPPPPSN
ncbi:MAG TPA: membrane lipoprotein lipid attachment site-containing protein [Steroidobacteraceae bacterium]|nr:membrane lipoprotein lipid attachment site-containing protein [Steroidobacteraceae bacterium]